MTQLSDEFLLAYLDGQLEKGQTAEVSQLAGSNPEVSRRVARLKRTQAQLVEAFGSFAREEIEVPRSALQMDGVVEAPPMAKPASLPPRHTPAKAVPKRPGAVRQLFFLAAVFASGLAGGYGATLLAPQRAAFPPKIMDRPPGALPTPASWPADIAKFHSFFPKEMLTPHPEAIANPEFIRFQLSKITAKALTPPDFSHQGFKLYRGQTLKYNQDNMMQLTYSSKTEAPLTLYVLPADGYSDSPIHLQTFGSYKAVSWVSNRVRFLLTAEKNPEDLKVLAVIAQSQMPRKR
jgi:anti-sigma factor RsiW